MFIYTLVYKQQAACWWVRASSSGSNAAQINNQNKGFCTSFLVAFFFSNSLPFGAMGATSQRAQRGRRGGRKERGREEATERGTVSSHCSIKSVGNDQD